MSTIPAGTMVLALLILSCCSVLASAQSSIELQSKEGRVWIAVANATAGDILREWQRRGGPRMVNADAIDGLPLTFQLDGVSGREALDVILRDTAGYIALLGAAGVDQISSLKTIVVLPKSRAAAPQAEVSGTEAGGTRDHDESPESFAAALFRSGRPDAPARPGEPNPDLPQPLLEIIRAINPPTRPLAPRRE